MSSKTEQHDKRSDNMSDVYGRTDRGEKQPCRSRACTDVNSWLKMYGKNKQSSKSNHGNNTESVITSESQSHVECPLDRDELGRNTWSFLHSMSAYYPDKPTVTQQKDMDTFISTFSKFYPCDHCAEDFRESIKKTEPDTSSQQSLSKWMCERHNEVNVKLGKPVFDCTKVTERWRDGWEDGSCD